MFNFKKILKRNKIWKVFMGFKENVTKNLKRSLSIPTIRSEWASYPIANEKWIIGISEIISQSPLIYARQCGEQLDQVKPNEAKAKAKR